MHSDIRLSLGYCDPVAAIRFLTGLGFDEGVVYDGEDGEIYHAEVSWPAGGVTHIHSAKPDGNSISNLADRAASDGGYPAFSVHIGLGLAGTHSLVALCRPPISAHTSTSKIIDRGSNDL